MGGVYLCEWVYVHINVFASVVQLISSISGGHFPVHYPWSIQALPLLQHGAGYIGSLPLKTKHILIVPADLISNRPLSDYRFNLVTVNEWKPDAAH